MNKKLIAIAIIIAGVLIAGAIFYINQGKGEKIAGFLTAQQAAEKTINFINQYLVEPGMVVSLLNVGEEHGLYKISFKAGEEKLDSYVTRDGKLLFFQGIDLEQDLEAGVPTGQETQEQEEFSDEQLETLAKCLNEKGAKFYGLPTCPWCKRQREMFGQAAQYLPYVDCEEKKDECEAANVGGVPDWRFPDGTQKLGLQSVEKLAELSGCLF